MGQTLGNPAVMNTESSQLRIEDDFNTCSLCDTFHDNGDESTCNPPLSTSPVSSLPIWAIHPLAMWASVSQGPGTCLRGSRGSLWHLWGGTLLFRLQHVTTLSRTNDC